MSWIEIIITFLFWLLTLLLAHRIGWLKGKSLVKKMIGKNIRNVSAFLLLIVASSCGSVKPAIMSYLGDVILVNDCQVCVSYVNVESDNSKSLGCFAHYEGHAYQVGDKYPQASKHSTGIPVKCGAENQLQSKTKNK